ncbi:MAG: hydroxyacylglutathione hydrolase [Methanobacteriota archaeon]|jgi:hydroxyacylglutathione hydrolase|uniref:MBL fold metallo-hydrolase n=1 Tax=Halorutilus salinus TaxID=2487751 RepID=A0A9Q4C4H0_9EURY|nr:MBL fold metallo-hydrolase [Halorutilus salinus]MCX2818966.1 MBL fold metallo-hydrolase [Halorutilus salinus]
MNVETIRDDGFASNVYRVGDSLVDAGNDASRLPPAEYTDAVYLTHAHADHADALRDYDVPVYVHPCEADAEPLSGSDIHEVNEGDEVVLGGTGFHVLHTPGHSPGSVCYWSPDERILFSGDLVFDNGAPGRADTPDGDAEALRVSLERLGSLRAERAYPGHREPFGEVREKVRVAVNLA